MSLATTSLSPSPCIPLPQVWGESAPARTPQVLASPHLPSPLQRPALPCSPQAVSTTEHQMGWHRLASWPNGCLFKHWSCLHCCGSLHVKHSPPKPYANPIKVPAAQCGEAITLRSQVCLLSSRKGNLIEQLKGKSDSARHHVEDRRLHCSRSAEGRGKSMTARASSHTWPRGLHASPLGTRSCLCPGTPAGPPLGSPFLPVLLFTLRGVHLFIFFMTNCHPP